jgi:hypothetical protein
MLLLALDIALGVLLLSAIAVLATRKQRRPSERARTAGWLLVAIPLPLAVALHLAGTLSSAVDQTLFIVGIAAFAAGSALLLGQDEDDWREFSDDAPPWWPDFERAFREYSGRPRPTARV